MSVSRFLQSVGDRVLGRLLPTVEASAQLAPYCWIEGVLINNEAAAIECCRYSDGSISCG